MGWRDVADRRGTTRSGLRRCIELIGVSSLAIAWPVLDAFGRSPETFIARHASGWEIVGFALVVFLGPPIVLLALEAAAGTATRTSTVRLHDALVVLVAGGALARWVRDVVSISRVALAGAAALGIAIAGVLWTRSAVARQVVGAMGFTSIWYVAAFLFLSPAGALVLDSSGRTGIDRDIAAAVRPALAGTHTPIVVVVFDALPTVALLDGHGRIDERVAPHLADLAGRASWYRNNTTVSGWTLESLGVIATGTLPSSPARDGLHGAGTRNLFTLLSDAYEMHVHEPVTRLCPVRTCPLASGGALPSLLDDAAHMWWRGAFEGIDQTIPGELDSARLDRAESWVDDLDVGVSGRPDLVFLHVLLPHDPFEYLPNGDVYQASQPVSGIRRDRWVDRAAADVARERHLLQVGAADALLGHLEERLRDAGVYDDALVVVTADHGIAFTTGQPSRGVSRSQYEQILWTPLFVKYPGQATGEAIDTPTRSTDIVPTIADALGVDIPWRVDGLPVRLATPARSPVLQDWVGNHLGAPGSDDLVSVDGDEGFARVLEARALSAPGPLAIWQTASETPLIGRQVDDLDLSAPSGRRPSDAPTLTVAGLDQLRDVDLDAPLPLEVLGEVSGAEGRTLALALNGEVAATVQIDETTRAPVRALLLPSAFVAGDNSLTACVLDDDGRVVGPVAVRPAR